MRIGVGQPLSRKLKSVHLPHPHPKGGLCLVVQVVRLSEVSTPGDEVASDFPSGVVFLPWLGTSTERESTCTFIPLLHRLPFSADGKSINIEHTDMNVQKQ